MDKVGKVVTKGLRWRKAKSTESGICIPFSSRDNSSFRLNTPPGSVVPLAKFSNFFKSLVPVSVSKMDRSYN